MVKQNQPKSGAEPGGQKAVQETGEKSVVPAEPVPPNVYDDLKKMKPDTTEVSVRAEFSIGKDKVVVNTKDIQKGDFVFELTQRA